VQQSGKPWHFAAGVSSNAKGYSREWTVKDHFVFVAGRSEPALDSGSAHGAALLEAFAAEDWATLPGTEGHPSFPWTDGKEILVDDSSERVSASGVRVGVAR